MIAPGLTPSGAWDLPQNLNMAQQCLDHDPNAVAIIDLSGQGRQDVTYAALRQRVMSWRP